MTFQRVRPHRVACQWAPVRDGPRPTPSCASHAYTGSCCAARALLWRSRAALRLCSALPRSTPATRPAGVLWHPSCAVIAPCGALALVGWLATSLYRNSVHAKGRQQLGPNKLLKTSGDNQKQRARENAPDGKSPDFFNLRQRQTHWATPRSRRTCFVCAPHILSQRILGRQSCVLALFRPCSTRSLRPGKTDLGVTREKMEREVEREVEQGRAGKGVEGARKGQWHEEEGGRGERLCLKSGPNNIEPLARGRLNQELRLHQGEAPLERVNLFGNIRRFVRVTQDRPPCQSKAMGAWETEQDGLRLHRRHAHLQFDRAKRGRSDDRRQLNSQTPVRS